MSLTSQDITKQTAAFEARGGSVTAVPPKKIIKQYKKYVTMREREDLRLAKRTSR